MLENYKRFKMFLLKWINNVLLQQHRHGLTRPAFWGMRLRALGTTSTTKWGEKKNLNQIYIWSHFTLEQRETDKTNNIITISK